PSLGFGLASLVEYATCYTDTVCGGLHCPWAANPYPFKMDQPLTSDINQVNTVLQTIKLIGGANDETYIRSFHEAATNPVVGWRPCSRRLWLNFGDEYPDDCNVLACIGGNRVI